MKVKIAGRSVWINYHHLYCFFIIASEGGLVSASKKLNIGQSALSIQLKQFEANIGTQLFERSHRKLTMNESGRLLFSYAKEIFRLGTEMIEVLNDQATSGKIHLQVGALDTIPKHLTVQLAQAALNGGKCTIVIMEGKPQELSILLSEHKIDLLLTNFLPSIGNHHFYHKRIARLPLWVVGNEDFLSLKRNFPFSLRGKPFVLPTSDSCVRQEINSFCKKNELAPEIVAEAQDVMVQKMLALGGVGLTVVPEFAIKEYLANKSLYLLGRLKESYEDLYLVSASRRIENPIASHLMQNFKIK